MGTRVMSEFSHDSSSPGLNENENAVRIRRDLNLGFDGESTPRIPVQTPPSSNGIQSHTDQVQKLAGLSIGFCSIFAEQLLSHPCIVLRRQCQVHHGGSWHHLTPISLVQIVINIQRTQGGLVLWKGLGGVYIVKGIGIVSESLLSEVTTFPREVSRRSTLKKYGGHLLLKSLVFALSTPFYTASLIETVQSDIASERPGVFDVLFEGVARIGSWGVPRTSRQLPIWQLALPTVVLRLSHYVVSSIAQFTVTSTMQLEQQEMRDQPGQGNKEPSSYEVYFPELLASFTGGIMADIITFPLETVLHRLYVQGTRTIIDNTDSGLGVVPIITGYEGFVDCFRGILAEEGIPGFYRGFGALALQYGIHAIILRMAMFLFDKLSKEVRRRQELQRQSKGSSSYRDLKLAERGDAL
ncbi:solute carrier family 25 member 46 [Aplysia californica]|uniref:Solute carrier family 25 member 46 n=1 Tax=Aplysia californica TaxID=6500 RepID=A0ABM0JM74_APLCA|nr:solute carrier family 25 member 46 [Aplysia californica]